jgi:hypothetical protein
MGRAQGPAPTRNGGNRGAGGHGDPPLQPTSPCRKKASDGGDIGCRFTPEMLEVLEKALELRKKGIIKF